MITIYNTLTRKKEEFKTIEKGKVKMYVCGPTVYDVPHIGHARSAYIFEIVRSYFEHAGFDVFMVRNVTDVDDKIIKRAGELGESTEKVARRYLDVYRSQMELLGIRPPDEEPKATENINEMIRFIEVLIEKGHAYSSGGDVYFSVDSFPDYGRLSHQDKDQMMHGARVEVGEKKRSPLDFALWKEGKEGEPSWDSPWGKGRPGWHIECSVMSTNIFGPSFDIHGGGLDLIFPHHENEIAQAVCATGQNFANYWIHNGLLTVNGEKMAKSLGNFITVADFLEKYRDPDLLKIMFLNSHYRSPVNYSEEKVEEARSSKERILIFLDKADRLEAKKADSKAAEEFVKRYEGAMADDFNTPEAVATMFDAVSRGNEILAGGASSDKDKAVVKAIAVFLKDSAKVLGLSLVKEKVSGGEAREIEKLISEREGARKSGNYDEADRIRQKLSEMGVTVEDTPEGTVWRKS